MIGMRRSATAFVGVVAATLAMMAGSGVAAAQELPEPPKPNVVFEGRSLQPTRGEVVETKEHEITPGGGPVGTVWKPDPPRPGMVVPLVELGTSYARSTETFQFFYEGRAKAAANVYQGLRIIRVTMQYNRRNNQGVDQVVGTQRTSFATCPASFYQSGPEVRTSATDSLGFSDPPTRFIYSTGRVSTTQRCG